MTQSNSTQLLISVLNWVMDYLNSRASHSMQFLNSVLVIILVILSGPSPVLLESCSEKTDQIQQTAGPSGPAVLF